MAKKKKMKEEHKRRQANPFTGEGGPERRWAWADDVKPGENDSLALHTTRVSAVLLRLASALAAGLAIYYADRGCVACITDTLFGHRASLVGD